MMMYDLNVKLVSLENIVRLAAAPVHHCPVQMVLNHGDHSMLYVLLLGTQLSWHLLAKLCCKGFDDHVRVSNLLSIELYEGQHPLLRAELALVIHIHVLDAVQ